MESEDSNDLNSNQPSKKRIKGGGLQVGSVFVNVEGLDSEESGGKSRSGSQSLRSAKEIKTEKAEPTHGVSRGRDVVLQVSTAQDDKVKAGATHRSAQDATDCTSVHFRGISYNASTADVQVYLEQCGGCPVRAVRWPNSRDRNCGSASLHQPRVNASTPSAH